MSDDMPMTEEIVAYTAAFLLGCWPLPAFGFAVIYGNHLGNKTELTEYIKSSRCLPVTDSVMSQGHPDGSVTYEASGMCPSGNSYEMKKFKAISRSWNLSDLTLLE